MRTLWYSDLYIHYTCCIRIHTYSYTHTYTHTHTHSDLAAEEQWCQFME